MFKSVFPKEGNEARYFYSDVMGLTKIAKPAPLIPNGGIWYQVADIQLHIGQQLTLHDVTLREEIQIPGQKLFSLLTCLITR